DGDVEIVSWPFAVFFRRRPALKRFKQLQSSGEIDSIEIAGDCGIPAELLLYDGLQSLSGGRLAVCEKGAFWRGGEWCPPPPEVALPRVSGELSQLDDFGVNGYGRAEDGKRFGTIL